MGSKLNNTLMVFQKTCVTEGILGGGGGGGIGGGLDTFLTMSTHPLSETFLLSLISYKDRNGNSSNLIKCTFVINNKGKCPVILRVTALCYSTYCLDSARIRNSKCSNSACSGNSTYQSFYCCYLILCIV